MRRLWTIALLAGALAATCAPAQETLFPPDLAQVLGAAGTAQGAAAAARPDLGELLGLGGAARAPSEAAVGGEQAMLPPPLARGVLGLNIAWVLLGSLLTLLLQVGLALYVAGFTRAKNVAHSMATGFAALPVAALGFWAWGFAIQSGGIGASTSVTTIASLGSEVQQALNAQVGFHLGDAYFAMMGNAGFFLEGKNLSGGVFALFFFQLAVMALCVAIPAGALAERWRFGSFALVSLLVGSVVYPLLASWIWGGGWLAALGQNFHLGHGAVDFAGSGVVHLVGGTVALVGALLLGPRRGKFNRDGSPNPIPGHNLAMVFLGGGLLLVGWLGYCWAFTLAATDSRIAVVMTNALLSGAAGTVTTMALSWFFFGKPDPSFLCGGMLAGLVAACAPCAFIDSWAAVLVGAVAGVLVLFGQVFVERTLRVDDPVGAITTHGLCGLWGMLALGLFANGRYGEGWNGIPGRVRGLFFGDAAQLGAQALGALVCLLVAGLLVYGLFSLVGLIAGNRVEPLSEVEGLDQREMGVHGYQPDAEPDEH